MCGMQYLPPFVVHGTHAMTEAEIRRHGEDYRAIITGLRDGKVDLEAARRLPMINLAIKSIITE